MNFKNKFCLYVRQDNTTTIGEESLYSFRPILNDFIQ